ncbi:MAG: hypothetical protein HQK55_14910 [Deltaproteobacteria bacterium]|nr:hypothetical protein [Deltaproteobacteria bacterium]
MKKGTRSIFLWWSVGLLVAILALAPIAMTADSGEKHPHMKAAAQDLQKAAQQLQAADRDYGGHRTKALEAVHQALKEIKEGIEFDNKNEKKK